MRTEERSRTTHESDPNPESGYLDRARAQYESLTRLVSDAIVETRMRSDFVEVPCKLAPAIRRRRPVS